MYQADLGGEAEALVPRLHVGVPLCPAQVSPSGTLELHGAWFGPTWTRLAATAAPGASSVQLQVRGRTIRELKVTLLQNHSPS